MPKNNKLSLSGNKTIRQVIYPSLPPTKKINIDHSIATNITSTLIAAKNRLTQLKILKNLGKVHIIQLYYYIIWRSPSSSTPTPTSSTTVYVGLKPGNRSFFCKEKKMKRNVNLLKETQKICLEVTFSGQNSRNSIHATHSQCLP